MSDTTPRMKLVEPAADKTDPYTLNAILRQYAQALDANAMGYTHGVDGSGTGGVLALAPTSYPGFIGHATDNASLYYSDGSTWRPIHKRLNPRTISDGFPSAVAGEQATFVIAQGSQINSRCYWNFAYDPTNLGDTYHWQFTGGSPIAFRLEAGETLGAGGAADFLGGATPFKGMYHIRTGAVVTLLSGTPPASGTPLVIGLHYASDGAAPQIRNQRTAWTFSPGQQMSLTIDDFVLLSTTTNVNLWAQAPALGSMMVLDKWLEIMPLRVGP